MFIHPWFFWGAEACALERVIYIIITVMSAPVVEACASPGMAIYFNNGRTQ